MLSLLILSLLASSTRAFDSTWRSGRATFYGLDGWDIMKGSCAYGQLGLQEVSRLCIAFADRDIGEAPMRALRAFSAPWMERGRFIRCGSDVSRELWHLHRDPLQPGRHYRQLRLRAGSNKGMLQPLGLCGRPCYRHLSM